MKQKPKKSRFKLSKESFINCLRSNMMTIASMVGLIVGLILGVLLKTRSEKYSKRESMYVGFVGELFLRMLKGIIIPLIVPSIIVAIGTVSTQVSGRIGAFTMGYYLLTTVIAIVLGCILVVTIKPGRYHIGEKETTQKRNVLLEDTVLDMLRNIFPANIIGATMQITHTEVDPLANDTFKHEANFKIQTAERTNFLGLIMFSIVFGLACSFVGDAAQPVILVLKGISMAAMKITNWIIYLSPVGIAFLVAGKITEVADYKVVLADLGLYILTVLLGLFIHGLIILPLLFFAFTRTNPFPFMANMGKALLTAFGTASSAATIPVSLNCLEEKNMVDSKITRFIIPIGATVNMDGTALYEAVAPIFIAQALELDLTTAQIVVISIVATAASIGAAGIPSAGLITMAMVLDTVDISSEHIGMILVIDWLLDRYNYKKCICTEKKTMQYHFFQVSNNG